MSAAPCAAGLNAQWLRWRPAKRFYAEPRQYLKNGLSDLLFVLARVLNRHAGGADVLWKHEKKR